MQLGPAWHMGSAMVMAHGWGAGLVLVGWYTGLAYLSVFDEATRRVFRAHYAFLALAGVTAVAATQMWMQRSELGQALHAEGWASFALHAAAIGAIVSVNAFVSTRDRKCVPQPSARGRSAQGLRAMIARFTHAPGPWQVAVLPGAAIALAVASLRIYVRTGAETSAAIALGMALVAGGWLVSAMLVSEPLRLSRPRASAALPPSRSDVAGASMDCAEASRLDTHPDGNRREDDAAARQGPRQQGPRDPRRAKVKGRLSRMAQLRDLRPPIRCAPALFASDDALPVQRWLCAACVPLLWSLVPTSV